MRDLVRAREDSVREQRNARHRLKALLLRLDLKHLTKLWLRGAGRSGRTDGCVRS
jgi:hypothetical protein